MLAVTSFWAMAAQPRTLEVTTASKSCPMCQKIIHVDAIGCYHCGRMLPAQPQYTASPSLLRRLVRFLVFTYREDHRQE